MDAPLVLGTAGHIDHGKSSLVRALTGVDPDRLSEEKVRGITIELGFAQLELPSGRRMGVVDVPGHERFVRQMVAGATGIDLVLLVIAADDGIMPQTREHLAIVELLGVDKGVVALTKADLVDEDWLALVEADVEDLLGNTPLAGAPIVPVSSRTGQGLDELRTALDAVADTIESRVAGQIMRLPTDRVFSIQGAGTVVTGTLWSGSIRRDDPIEIFPTGHTGRVRSVQVHGDTVDVARAGQRVAVNIAGLEKSQIDRGDVVAPPDSLLLTDRFDASLTFLGRPSDDGALETGTRVHIHHGTREVIGRILFMDGLAALVPGEEAFAQIRLEEPITPLYGDRFVVRSYSPVYTIGGGVILDVHPHRRTNLTDAERALLQDLLDHDIAAATVGLVRTRRTPMTSDEVAVALGVDRAQVAGVLNTSDLARVKVAGKAAYIDAEALDSLVDLIERELLAFHERDPIATGVAPRALRDLVDRRMSIEAFDALAALAQERGVVRIDGGRISHPEATVSSLAEEEKVRDVIEGILENQLLTPASTDELIASLPYDKGLVRKALGQLVTEGRLIRLSADLHFTAPSIATAKSRIEEFISAWGPATAADLRDALGTSRKFAIPLLEYFDATGVTKREGDLRSLRG